MEMKSINNTQVTVFFLLQLWDMSAGQVIFMISFAIIYGLTLSGNLIIIIICRFERTLHTPMYFFLSHLAALEMCYISVTLPKMLHVSTECFLLAIMAYDRFVAVCKPLRYQRGDWNKTKSSKLHARKHQKPDKQDGRTRSRNIYRGTCQGVTKTLNFRKAKFDQLRDALNLVDWDNILRNKNTDNKWKMFKNILNRHCKRFTPCGIKRTRNRKNPMWLNKEVRQAINSKKKAFALLRQDGTIEALKKL
ncbi:unnamed protein product, partial [Ranitomeya imitator]